MVFSMKQYKIILRRAGHAEIADGFLSEREVVNFLKGQGFYWNTQYQKWEQTYIYTDVYSDYDLDRTWTGAEVIELQN